MRSVAGLERRGGMAKGTTRTGKGKESLGGNLFFGLFLFFSGPFFFFSGSRRPGGCVLIFCEPGTWGTLAGERGRSLVRCIFCFWGWGGSVDLI